jgi:hypothetical protein
MACSAAWDDALDPSIATSIFRYETDKLIIFMIHQYNTLGL